jgi:hypothetical protein
MADDFDFNDSSPEEQSNRTFLMAVAGIGALLVLSMICLALYALVLAPAQEQRRIAQATEIIIENTQVAAELTETAEAERATPTSPATQTSTPLVVDSPTPTQVVVIPTSTSTPFTTLPTAVILTETAAAQQTIDAGAQLTPTPTATALPSTGFADEVGLPSLLMVGGLMVVVILFARRLRLGGSSR